MNKPIQAWSPSLLQVYEECPHRAYLRAVARIKEPERPPLPNGKEYPNDRGNRLHEEAEQFVRGQRNRLGKEFVDFAEDLKALRDMFEDGDVELEDLWCFDEDWELVPKKNGQHQWREHWARIKLDALAKMSSTHYVVIDYKSGKRIGNELKHGDQVLIYAIATLMIFDEVEEVTVELWYLDQSLLVTKHYTREQVMRFMPSVERRGVNCTTDTSHEPDPTRHNCRFCPFKTGKIGKLGPMGTGHCKENLRVEHV